MSGIDDFFDDADRRLSASARLKDKGDLVKGEVVDQFEIDYVPFGKKDPAKDERTGETIKQLVIVLQTSHRNWENVARIPEDADENPRPPEQDEGFRAVYVRKYTNIHSAFGEALRNASTKAGRKVRVENGGTLGVRVADLDESTIKTKGNAKKVHQVYYEPPAQPAASDSFFGGGDQPAASQAPAQQPAQQVQQAPAPAQDPWTSNAVQTDEPPF